ncbi:Rrp15p-domain-containing protein [Armillaria fumosa]|nr:Rrp15p-domain-containing protein [Armillaria fumosa]
MSASLLPRKRQRLSDDEHANDSAVSGDDELVDESGSDDFASASDENSDDDDIQNLKPQKSRQTKKRKIRATAPSTFGSALQSLLGTDAPSALPLSLKPSVARKRNDEKLESKAKKVLQVEKKEKEDKGRIRDIYGGWGAESERALRKVAQRGVVKLFNVIQQAQADANNVQQEKKAARGRGKPSLPAPATDKSKSSKGKNRDNLIGRGKEAAVEKDDFFDMIRSGGLVSKA